jgi:acetylornithine/LysW-gamma-L-lysine aminotransferase
MNSRQIIELEQRHTSGFYPKRDAAFVRGAGALVRDAEGNEYIDCTAGHGVALLGHCHPAVAEAVARQSRVLITLPEIFFSDVRARLMERLCALLPGGMERIFLCNSGAEAVEAALKTARLATGRNGFVAAKRGFHGRTMGALSATWEPRFREPFLPLVDGFVHVPFDDADAMDAAVTSETAAVIVEPVQGEGGVRPGSRGYFRRLRETCDRAGALLVADEVQTGFGRTGAWFACEHFDLRPDLVCLGKGMAGGLPMGALAMGPAVGELPPGAHGSTFGGNPLACAAALAAIDALEAEGLVAAGREKGAALKRALEGLGAPVIREVRGLGLMIGVDLRKRVTPLLKILMDEGVLALPAGSTVLRLLPPLVISDEQIEAVVGAIARSLERFEKLPANRRAGKRGMAP